MKKFIAPSMEIKKFNRASAIMLSGEPVTASTNIKNAETAMEGTPTAKVVL